MTGNGRARRRTASKSATVGLARLGAAATRITTARIDFAVDCDRRRPRPALRRFQRIPCRELTGRSRETQWGCKLLQSLKKRAKYYEIGRETQWRHKPLSVSRLGPNIPPDQRETASSRGPVRG